LVQNVTGHSYYGWGLPFPPLVPGSQYRIEGSTLSPSATIGAIPVWPLAVSPAGDELIFQVPFEMPAGGYDFSIPGKSLFEFRWPVEVRETAPAFLHYNEVGTPLPLQQPVAVHADFKSFVTPDSPAVPGEVIHFFMTGLGTVTPSVPTGAPAPASPPGKLTSAITLSLVNYASHPAQSVTYPVDVLFAGLAPGFVGVYQVSVRMPDSTPGLVSQDFYVTVQEDGESSGFEPFPFAAK
jgi:uncharacterized protein (TIGR03437 family)